MNNDHNFLVTYGLHNFVTHAKREGKHVFTIRALENQKLIRHARALIDGCYGQAAAIQMA
jgi:hypothetical protein